MSFTIFKNKKKPFQALKTRSSKSRIIGNFPKGLTHRFGPQKAIFPNSFFRHYREGKCLLGYSRTKEKPFQAIKTIFSRSRKIDIFPKGITHRFGPKMAIFPNSFFQAIQATENVFHNILEQKIAFLGYKNQKFKKSKKNDIFLQGLSPWFSSRNGPFFQTFILGNKGWENVFHDILEQKKAFLGYKNKQFKKSKN